MRRFVSAGERLSRQLVDQWRRAVGGELLNLYGMSETFCACMMTPPGSSDGMRTGVPFDGVRVELRDASGATPAPGEPGVLWVQHPALASGYASLPAETAALFRDGWFCSRDLFVRDAEGHYIHQGRSDELIKVAGQWVQPGELEEAAALEPAVAEAVCVPVHDADAVRMVETAADLLDIRTLLCQRQLLPPLDDVGQRRAVDILHGDERLMVVLIDLVNGDQVLVSEVCRGARFPEEPLQQLVVSERLSQHFDGNLSIQIRIAPEIHRPHPAVAEAAHD